MTLDARQVLEDHNGVFLDRGCLFVSTTGNLLNGYVNCEVIYPYSDIVWDLTAQLVGPFLGEAEGFICPATGDIVLLEHASLLARDYNYPTIAVWADKHGDGADSTYHIERNGYEAAVAGKKVVILNDRISQGGTTKKVIAEARRLDCDVLAVATLAGVSGATPDSLSVPRVHALCTIDVAAFPVNDIPPQYQGLPIAVDEPLGHGADFQKENPDFEGGFITLLG